MKLSGENQTIEFDIVGYEYDEPRKSWWDNNWLLFQCKTAINKKVIEGTFPCFLTIELQMLKEQLERYRDRKVKSFEWGGTEPNFSVEIHGNGLIEIFFYPENGMVKFGNIEKFRKIMTDEDVDMFIRFCKDRLLKYPVRELGIK